MPDQASQYSGLSADDILKKMYQSGFTQEGVNRVYEMRNLGPAPTIPASAIGAHTQGTKGGLVLVGSNGKPFNSPDARGFLNTLNTQAVDPFNHYDVGNWLGTAGLIVGGAGAGGAFGGGGALGGGAGGGALEGGAGALEGGALGSSAGALDALPEIVVTGTTGSGLGAAAGGLAGAAGAGYSGSSNQAWQNTSNPAGSFANAQTGGNAGALSNSGGIGGGAGAGGTTSGAFGNASVITNYLGGTGGGSMAGGNLWGNLAQLGGSLYNTYQQQQGAKDASKAAQAGDAAGIAEQRREFDLARGDQMPWLTSGTAALNRLNDPTAFTQSPGYAFARDEALKGAQNSAAARGGLFSGNTARALEDRAGGLASLDFNNWFNQQSSLAGLGQNSAQSLASVGQNSANNVSNLLSNQGNARASGIVDSTNAITGGVNDISTLLGNYFRNKKWGGS